jgi:hypothetical protein
MPRSSNPSRALTACALGLLLVWPGPLARLAAADEPLEQPADVAKELVRQGIQLRKQGRDRAALELIRRAHQLAPTPHSHAQLGLVYQAVGDFVRAERHLLEALGHGDHPWVARNRGALQTALIFTRQRLASVVLRRLPEQATVSVDGEPPEPVPADGTVRVAAGTVRLAVAAPGYRPRVLEVTSAAETTRELPVVLEKEPAAAPPPVPPATPPPTPTSPPPVQPAGTTPPALTVRLPASETLEIDAATQPPVIQRRLAWSSAALGAAMLAVGVAGLVVREQRARQFDGPGCLSMSQTRLDNCRSVYDSGQTARQLGIAGLVTGGVLATTSVVLFVWRRRPGKAGAASAASFSLAAGGARCDVRF